MNAIGKCWRYSSPNLAVTCSSESLGRSSKPKFPCPACRVEGPACGDCRWPGQTLFVFRKRGSRLLGMPALLLAGPPQPLPNKHLRAVTLDVAFPAVAVLPQVNTCCIDYSLPEEQNTLNALITAPAVGRRQSRPASLDSPQLLPQRGQTRQAALFPLQLRKVKPRLAATRSAAKGKEVSPSCRRPHSAGDHYPGRPEPLGFSSPIKVQLQSASPTTGSFPLSIGPQAFFPRKSTWKSEAGLTSVCD